MSMQNWLNCIREALPNVYTNQQFQNSQEFALDGGVIFDTLGINNESHADEVFISVH